MRPQVMMQCLHGAIAFAVCSVARGAVRNTDEDWTVLLQTQVVGGDAFGLEGSLLQLDIDNTSGQMGGNNRSHWQKGAELALVPGVDARDVDVEGIPHSVSEVSNFWLIVVIIIESSVLLFTIGIPCFVWLTAYILGRVIKGAIETFDRLVIGTDVMIKDLRTNIFNGVVSIEGLEVANPEAGNYDSKYLLKAGIVHIDLDMGALLCSCFRHFKVEKMEFKNVDVIVEKGRNSSNVQDVQKFLQSARPRSLSKESGSSSKAKSEDKPLNKSDVQESKGVQVTLHEVVIEDVGARVQAQVLGGRGMRVSVGDVRYKDFDEEVGESTVGPIVQVLLRSVLKTVAVNIVGKQIGEYCM